MPGTVYIIIPGPFQRKTRYSTSKTDTMRTMRFVEIHVPVNDVSGINNQMHLYMVNLSEFGFRICHLPTGCILFDCCCRVIRVFAIKPLQKISHQAQAGPDSLRHAFGCICDKITTKNTKTCHPVSTESTHNSIDP